MTIFIQFCREFAPPTYIRIGTFIDNCSSDGMETYMKSCTSFLN